MYLPQPREEIDETKLKNCGGVKQRTDESGRFHCVKGPAVETVFGYKSYWKHGKRHRVDGPAVIWPDGMLEWWEDDARVDLYDPEAKRVAANHKDELSPKIVADLINQFAGKFSRPYYEKDAKDLKIRQS